MFNSFTTYLHISIDRCINMGLGKDWLGNDGRELVQGKGRDSLSAIQFGEKANWQRTEIPLY